MRLHLLCASVFFASVIVSACGSSKPEAGFSDSGSTGGDDTHTDGSISFGGDDSGVSFGGDGGTVTGPTQDPTTCAEAASAKSYVGCDYWPTVVANNVWSIFDFSVVVANAGTDTANITVTGLNGYSATATVAPQQLTKIYLPWVSALKGQDSDNCGASTPLATSVYQTNGAYHLVSSIPVTVYQFNALEYKGQGGPAGKSWASCPGNTSCNDQSSPNFGAALGCFSFSNDASLLLPSTAMTGNYRVAGFHGSSPPAQGYPGLGAYFAITATQNDTHVTVGVSSTSSVVAGGAISATAAGGLLSLTMQAGDVAEVLGEALDNADLSGSLVHADQPVQVIAGHPCAVEGEQENLFGVGLTCDHIEESVFPAETLGEHYFVTVPTSPGGTPVGHEVRLYGNVDGTTLTYANKPSGCPTSLNAGEVATCGIVSNDFEIVGTHEFAVGSFMLSGELVSTNNLGDPSESLMTAVEQYRTKYIFLAPNDYSVSFADIVIPTGATVTLDGQTLTTSVKAISGGYGVARVSLGAGQDGAHSLTATMPVGLQVMGYGQDTSYQYPGGLDLKNIAPPPPIPK